jgi:hypothetical protein
VRVAGVVAESQSVPVYVPFLFAGWGVLCWFAGARRMARDQRGEMRRLAEIRARSRLLYPFGGGDVEREFAMQWRFRWLWPVTAVGYEFAVLGMFVLAFWH